MAVSGTRLLQSRKCFIADAPIFHPTVKEFSDLISYISSIRPDAQRYGLCKIVVPPELIGRCSILDSTCSFQTRKQNVGSLQQRCNSEFDESWFFATFNAYLKAEGKAAPKQTYTVCGVEVPLWRLFKLVRTRGGYCSVTGDKGWREVARILKIGEKGGNITSALRQLYQKHLLPFEEYSGCCTRDNCSSERHKRKQSEDLAVAPGKENSTRSFSEEAGTQAAEIMTTLKASKECWVEPSPKRQRLDGDFEIAEVGEGSPDPYARVPVNISTMLCEHCHFGSHEDQIIICDGCDKGWHIWCRKPALTSVPAEERWICSSCIAGERNAGTHSFEAGPTFTLKEFETMANDFQEKWLGHAPHQGDWSALEETFWNIVEEGEEDLAVFYGADLDTKKVGTGFKQEEGPPSNSAWHLTNLPRQAGEHPSLLRHMPEDMAGVNYPWLYVGMLFSCFAWHIEDHMLYSINYHHVGAPKRWYGVPHTAIDQFETCFKATLPKLFERQPDLLCHLVTMLSPRILREHNIPVYKVLQEPGDLVVTFPGGYHCGFNLGFNCAEAVNFAPPEWLQHRSESVARNRFFRKDSLLSPEWLLLRGVQEDTGVS
eukprot:jgi/Botrbrau1/19298/Bobra.0073s0041.1